MMSRAHVIHVPAFGMGHVCARFHGLRGVVEARFAQLLMTVLQLDAEPVHPSVFGQPDGHPVHCG